MSRTVPAIIVLASGLLLAACNGNAVLAPASAPPPGAKPVLAAPPASLLTPHGY